MKTYCITSEFIYHISTVIHAESEEEAKRLFEELSMEQIVGANYIPLEDLEDGLVVGIYEDKYM